MTLRSSLALLAALALSGCGLFGGAAAPAVVADDPGPAPEAALPPGPAALSLVGAADMNAGGNAARVYLYPLSSDATFLATPVQAFWDDPEGVLADDLAGAVRDATVRPGASATLDGLSLDGAPYLGVAADLRAPDGDGWRAVLPAADVRGRVVRVDVEAGRVRVTSVPPAE